MSVSADVASEQVRAILDVSRLLAVTTEIDPLLVRIAEAATSLLNCERASIFVHDPQTHELWTKVALRAGEIRIPAAAGVAGHAFTTNRPLHVSDPYADPRFDPDPDRRDGFVTRNLLAVPMTDVDRQPIGVIEAVNKLGGDFTDEDRSLVALFAEQAGAAIQRYRLHVAAMQIVALRREMDLAHKVQTALIPVRCPTLPGFETCGWTQPASVTGGDCYDVWTLPGGRLALFVADASGHGLGASIMALEARALARALAPLEPDPHAVLARMHEQLAQDLEPGWFVTAFLGFLHPTGLLEWSSAGQGPIFLRPAGATQFQSVNPPAPPLGVPREFPYPAPAPVPLAPNGALVVASDGTHEVMNQHHEEWGIDRLLEVIEAHRHDPPENLIAATRDAARAWRGPREQVDDQTILIVRATTTSRRV